MYSPRFFDNLRIGFAIPTFISLLVAIISTFTIDTKGHGSLEGLVYIAVIPFDVILLGFTITGILTFLNLVGKRKQMVFPIVWSAISIVLCIFFTMFLMGEFRNPGAVLTAGGILFPNLCVFMFSLVLKGE